MTARLMRRSWSATLILALALLSSGCSGGDSPTDPGPANDSVVLESFEPASGTVLAPGSRVTFRGRVRYALASASTGRVSIIIQDQLDTNISPTSPQPSVTVTLGTGTVELADTITVPASGVTSVRVFYPLFPTGASRSSVVQSVVYSVR
jgi:hypothetical protein